MTRAWLIFVAGLAGFLIISYLGLTYALPLLLPFVVALLAAELLEPLVRLLTFRGRVARSIVVSVILILVVGLITLGLTAALARLIHEIQGVIEQLPYLYAVGVDLATRFAEQFGTFRQALPESMQEIMTRNLTSLQNSLSKELTSVASLLGTFTGVPAFLANLFIAVIATFFISRDRHQIGEFLLSLFPSDWRPQIRQVKNEVWASALGFARAEALLISLTMIQSIVGLAIIGSRYSLLLGVLIGFVDVLPVLGPAAIFIPWIIYSFVFGSQFFAVKLLILYGIVAAVRQVLEAKVVGDQVGLHPLAILISMYLGFQFFGGYGFIFGPLLAILLKTMLKSGLLPWH